ncbi:P-loop containing nucleoside triphosphate hydrolase protein [Mycena leptocephala]|nr:P-loop containing nucleoside triphosphate hydrolase protein [Mycena leptocephala]
MARAVANETGTFFFLINGPEIINGSEIMSKMAGESESNLRKAFEEAEKNSVRQSTGSGAPDLDGDGRHERKKNMFIIGATNRPDQTDSALLRPRRLDQLIYIPLPDEPSQLKKSPVSAGVDLNFLAKSTHGFSGADLTEICRRAAKLAIRESIDADIHRTREKREKDEVVGDDAMKVEDDAVEDKETPSPKSQGGDEVCVSFGVGPGYLALRDVLAEPATIAWIRNNFKFPKGEGGSSSAPAASTGNAGSRRTLLTTILRT